MMEKESENCKICGNNYVKQASCNVTRGIPALIEASKVRQDGLFSVADESTSIKIHSACRVKYTRKRDIDKLKKAENDKKVEKPTVTLRSSVPPFDFKINCMFCGDDANKEVEIKKPLNRRRKIHVVTLDKIEGLRKHANIKNDRICQDFLLRTEMKPDLVAPDARYHHDCYTSFLQPARAGGSIGRPKITEKEQAFQMLCHYIDEADDSQFRLEELIDKLTEFSIDGEIFSHQHIKRKLAEHYGGNLIIFKSYIIILRESAEKIINDLWQEKSTNLNDRKQRIINAMIAILKEDIYSTLYDRDTYEFTGDFKTAAEKMIPDSLKLLIEGIIMGRNNSDSKTRKCIAISHAIIAATRGTFLSRLQLALGVWLHKKYGSRQLIDMISRLGFCVSYGEVQRFETSVLKHESPDISAEGYIQYVFDNADLDLCTLTGRGTFHYMGGIKCISPARAVSSVTSLPRVNKFSVTEAESELKNIPFKIFQNSPLPGLCDIIMQPLTPIKLNNINFNHYTSIDLLCTVGRFINGEPQPSWHGYMQAAIVSSEPCEKTKVKFLPFITASPTDLNTIYSALAFAVNESRRRKKKFCAITFDQQLYIKAMDIVSSDSDLTKDMTVIIRLGGFHLLMSFLGSIGNIMKESGLEELWATVYAKKSIVHMMNGHAVARALRAHFLTLEALITIVLKNCENFNEKLKEELKLLHSELLQNTVTPREAADTEIIKSFHLIIQRELVAASSASRTAKLWYQYYEMVTLIRLFIRAERTGDFDLHLQVVINMLPYFHATAHLNYAKSSHLYIQNLINLKNEIEPSDYDLFVKYFTVRRNEDHFWSAVATDLVIEQDLMRSMKVSGGLAGRGVTENILATWIHSLPACIEYTQPLEEFTNIHAGTTNIHKELGKSRQKQDFKDAVTFTDWLSCHSPLDRSSPELYNIANGLIADEKVNCDDALSIGLALLEKVQGVRYGEIRLRRNDKVVPLAAVTKSIKIDNETMVIDPHQLFHRIICVVSEEKDVKDSTTYELHPHCPSLFDDDKLMRKSPKHQVVIEIMSVISHKEFVIEMNGIFIIDGGFLLHRAVWPTSATYEEIIIMYTSYVVEKYGTERCYVIFDGYDDCSNSTKYECQKSRAKSSKSKDIIFEEEMVPTIKQSDFLASAHNKARLISKLQKKMKDKNIHVLQATSDADVLIVETAISLASTHESVTVVGNDTDLLIVLLARAPSSANIRVFSPGCKNMKLKAKVYDIAYMQSELKLTAQGLLFFHAMTGCDTTSSLYRKGKKTAFKKFHNSVNLLQLALTFNEKDADPSDIVKAGEQFILALYSSKEPTLDSARYQMYHRINASKKVSSKFELATLPPTCAAARQHSLRVYHQVQQWYGNTLPPTEWGWRRSINNKLEPIPTLKPPAPEYLLKILRCNCLMDCSTNRCSCKKNGIKCSNMCGHCRGSDCSNICNEEIDITDDNEITDSITHLRPADSSASTQARKRHKVHHDDLTSDIMEVSEVEPLEQLPYSGGYVEEDAGTTSTASTARRLRDSDSDGERPENVNRAHHSLLQNSSLQTT